MRRIESILNRVNLVRYTKFCNNDDQYPSYAYNLDCAVSQSSRGRDSSGFHYCILPILTHYVEPVVQYRNQRFNIGNHSHFTLV